MRVPTVTGDVEVSDLGFTLMHEHLVLLQPEIELNLPGVWDEEAEIAKARAGLIRLRELGVVTLVDLTVYGLGRNIERVRRIVAGTGVNVIVATGMYAMAELPKYFQRRGPGTVNGGPENLEEMFVAEIENGIGSTGVHAGILKCVTDQKGLTPDVERTLRAAARAHRRTGVPISTHADAGLCRGRDQQRVFRAEGVDLNRVIIGHCGDTTDLAYLQELMDAGSYAGMDRFGMDNRLPTADRCATVAALARLGYARRMVLSHDASYFSEGWDPVVKRTVLPDWQHGFISERVLPRLRELGVSEPDITQMMVTNPADIFAAQNAY